MKSTRSRSIEYYQALNQAWTVIAFLLVVANLISVRGFDGRMVLLMIAPPGVAFIAATFSENVMAKIVGNSFLTLVSFGLLICHSPQHFPNLNAGFNDLQPEQDRALAWYFGVYLVFMMTVLPFCAIKIELDKHRLNEPTKYSKFLCWFAMVLLFFLGPLMTICILHILGFWPIYR